MSEADAGIELVEGRDCAGCVMCCKVFPIPETGKPDYGLCPHAREGVGCDDHAGRPDVCREFQCLWRVDASLGEDWKPDVAGFVLHDPSPWTLLVSCDVDRPDAWRLDPYGSQIQEWAVELQRRQMLMGRRLGGRTRLMLRDREVDLDG